jgi:hypothetical protein
MKKNLEQNKFRTALVKEIDIFLERTGMSKSSFGLFLFNDGKFLPQFWRGADIKISSIGKIREFLDNYNYEQPQRRGDDASA